MKKIYDILFFLLIFGFSVVWTTKYLVRSRADTTVPALLGKTSEEAKDLLRQRRLSLRVLGQLYSERYTEGTILEQTPPQDEMVREGREIGVYVSKGARAQPAPFFVGLDQNAANLILSSSNMKAIVDAQTCSDEYPEGTLVGQYPEAGKLIQDRAVHLLVSTGPCANRFVMSELTGNTLADMNRSLDQQGFQLRTYQYVEDIQFPENTITQQDPSAGTLVRPTDAISLTIAVHPELQDEFFEGGNEEGSWAYFLVKAPRGLLRREITLRVNRGNITDSYAIDFQLLPGENREFAAWLPLGSQVVIMMDGQEIQSVGNEWRS